MSLTEDVTTQALAGDAAQGRLANLAKPVARVLLVWDAPNLDMGLGSILGRRPTALERPRFDALGRWLLARTAAVAARVPDAPDLLVEPEATVFTNIAPGS